MRQSLRFRRFVATLMTVCMVGQPFAAAAASYNYQVPLTAPGYGPLEAGQLQFTPSSHDFGTLVLGSAAATSATLKNTGQDALHLTGLGISAPYAESNNCPSILVGGQSCEVTVTYTPANAGTYNTSLVVNTEEANAQTSFDITGAAVAQTSNLALSANLVDFGAVEEGTASSPRSLTITNRGNSPARINGIGISSGAADFSQSNNCGATLAPGASCVIAMSFVPSIYGARAGNLSLYEQASETLYSVALTGFGNDAILAVTPGAKALGFAIANYSNSIGLVTIANQGNIPMTGLSFDTASSTEFSVLTKTCTASLPAGDTCTVTLQFAPTATGQRSGSLHAYTTNAGETAVSLSGTGIAQSAVATASVSALSFAGVAVDASSEEQAVTFTNTGNVALTVTGVSFVDGGAHYTRTSTCGAAIAVGASCTAKVTFSPKIAGSLTGTLRAELSSGNLDVALTGTGTLGVATTNPLALAFADQQVASSSVARNVLVTNTGNRRLTFSAVGIVAGAADYGQTNNCVVLEPAASCTISVTFTPSTIGSRPGTVALAHDGVGATTFVDLSGSGRAQGAALSNPAFPSTAVGASSTAMATLSNTGIGALEVTPPGAGSVSGAGYSLVSSTCGATVAVGGSCAVTVRFAPTSTAATTGMLTLATGAGNQTATFGSTGIQGFASVSPAALSFAVQQLGTTSALQTVTVTNTGTNALTFTGVGISAGATDFAQSNGCGSIPVNGTCSVNVTFTPAATGARSGTLAFTHDGGGIATVNLSGAGQAPSAASSAASFAATQVGSSSTAVVTLTNTGVGSISVTAPTAGSVTGADFSFVSTTCGTVLAAGSTCASTVRFSPTSVTPRTGTLDVGTSAGTVTATLASTAVQGNVNLSAASLTFAAKQVGESAAVQSVTVTNNGTAPLTFSNVSISAGVADFAQASPACTTLAVNATCVINVTFTPSATGARSGTVTLAHNGMGATTVSLDGTGQAASAALSTPSFATTQVGSSSTALATLTNTGIGALSVTAPVAGSVTGTDFSFVSTTCGTSLAAGGACTTTVRFTPTTTTTRTGSLAIVTGAGSRTATLTSTGVQGNASLSAAGLTFAVKQVGESPAAQAITVTNNGTAPLSFTSVSVTAGATDYVQTSPTCTTLAVNATCTVNVTFTPTATGARVGTVTLSHNGTGATSFSLTGTGQPQSASLSTPAFASTAVGASSTATATLTNTGIGVLSVTAPTVASVTGPSYSFVSTTCASSLAAGATCTTTVRFSPTSTTAASGSLAIATGAGTQTVTLGSTGIQGFASVSPSSLTFAAQQNATTSGTQVVTVTNTGTNTLTFTGVGISAGATDFAQSNNCGSVAVAGSCTVNVTFTPSAAGSRPGTLSFTHDGGGIANVSLTGTGQVASSTLTTPAFSTTQVGSNSTAVSTLTNTGIGSISVTVPTVASVTGTDFTFVSTTCTTSLAAGGTCATTVRFTPTSTTARAGVLSVTTGAGAVTASLASTAVQGNASLTAGSLTFAATQVGTAAAGQTVTVTNNGTTILTFTSVSVTAGATDFTQSSPACTTLAVNGTCTITVNFTPTNTGTRSGTVTLAHNGTGSTTISLTGTGQAQSASLSTPTFPATAVGSSSTAIAILTNTGIGALSTTAPTAVSVAGAAYSFVSTTCASSLATGATCTTTVRFSPTSTTAASGSLAIATGAGTQTVALGSTGIQGFASVNPASLSYATQQSNSTSAAQVVTVTNTGTDTLTFTGVGVSVGATDFGQSNNCGAVAVGGTCTVNVTFTPSAAGTRTGTLAFTHNGGGIATVSLSGTGQAPSATLSNIAFGNVNAGASSTLTSTLTNTGLAAISVTAPTAAAVTGTDFSFVSTTCGASLAAGATCAVSVKLAPSSGGARSGTLSFATEAGTQTASLAGSGNQAVLTFSYQLGGTTVNWGNRQIGGSYNSAIVTLTNSGNVTASSLVVTPTSAWTLSSNTCSTSLAAGASCTFQMTLSPIAVQAYNGTVSATAAVANVTNLMTVTGFGVAQSATLSTPSFAATSVGSNSNSTATLTNTGVGPLSVTIPAAGSVTGASYSFVSTTCGTSVAVGATCDVVVKFSPSSTTASSGTLSVGTGAGTQSASLGSTGIQGFASVSPASLTFAAQQNGTTSAAQVVTVTNTGTDVLTFTGVGISSGATDFAQSNNCGAVAVNGTCTVNVTFTPSTAGARPGNLSFTHNGGGIANVSLTGTGQAASATLSTPSFATTQVGSNSAAVSTLTNTGIGSLSVTAPTAASVTGTDFSFVSTTCATSLAAGGTCTTTVRFTPTATTARSGVLSIVTGAGTITASLTSTGVQGNASLTAGSLTYAATQVGTAAGGQTVTVTNNGTTTLTFTTVSVTAGATDFTQTSPACTSLAVNGTCVITVNFTPIAVGARAGTVTLAHNGTGSTSISLTGTGQAQSASLSNPAFSSSIAVGANGTAVSTLTNTGIGSMTLTAPAAGSVTGTDFSFVSTTCGTSLAASGTCATTVRFSPTAVAARIGSLAITTSAGTQSATLSATGVQGNASLSAASLGFMTKQVGDSPPAQTVTVTNNGTNPLVFTSVSVTAGATDFVQASPACTTLAVNGTCTITVTFTPTAAGARTGAITLTHNGTGSTSISLSGTGQAQSASLATPAFPATAVGATNTATATLTNTGIGALSITVPTAASVTGATYSFISTTCPATLAVSGTCTTTVRFSPTSTTAASGSLAIATGAGTQTVSLGSTGIQGYASVSPASLTFATQQNSTTSGAQVVTVTNTGTNTLTFTGVGISSGATDFAQSNNCGAVAVNGTCTVNVTFTPSTAGARTGNLSFTHDGGGIANVSLTGTGQAASATLSAPAFPSTMVGGTNTAAATLTNTGIGNLSVTVPTAAAVTGTDFSFVATNCPATLAPAGTCITTVRFSPAATTARTGSVAISTGAGTQTATLAATGVQGIASLSQGSIAFSPKQVGESVTAGNVTVTNTGTSTLTFTSVSITAGATDFTQTSPTCTSLAVNATCTISVTFTPSTTGARTGTVTLAHNGTGSTAIPLTGTGQAQSASLSTPAFPATAVGGTNTAQATLTNTGVGTLTTTAPTAGSVTGAAYSFVSTTCSTSLTAGGTCATTVRFSPTSTAAASGTLAIGTGAGTQSVTLGSTGIQGYASVNPSSLTYGTYGMWTTSPVQTVTVTNTGTNTLTFTGVGISVGGSDFAQSNNCGAVAVNGTCTVNVTFSPSTGGARTGTLSFTHDGGGIANVSLSGTGQGPTGTLSMGAFPTTSVGSSSTAVATYTNTGIGPAPTGVPTAASVTGNAAFSFVSTTCTGSVPVSNSCATTIRFSPTSTAAATGNFAINDWNQWNNAALSATGIQGNVSLAPASLSFANGTTSTTSSTQSTTLTNNGNTSLVISSVTVTAGASAFTRSTNCVGTIGVGATCSISSTFSPVGAGANTGTITIAHNGSGPTTIALSGTAYVPASVTGASFSPATVTTGNASNFSWTTSNASSATVACTGTAAGSGSGTASNFNVSTSGTGTGTCTVTAYNPAGTPATGAANLSVVAAPGVATASFSPSTVMAGNTATFSWTTSNATSASVSCGAPASGSGSGLSGSITVSTTAAGTGYCTTTAYNAAGNSSANQANITVTPAYSYSWQTSGYSTPAACGATTATRSVWCQRSDGATVSDAFCGAGKPAATTGTTDYSACTYNFQYGGWSTPSGCGTVTQTRTASCQRSDGATVSNAYCGTPTTSQSTTDYNSCSYSYSYGSWSTPSGCGTVTQTRSATCKRSDGATVSSAYCGAATTSQSAADFSACSYSANLGGWSGCSNTCGTGTQSRSVSCTRSDGATVANSSCGSPATSQSCTGNTGCAPPPIIFDGSNNSACAPEWDQNYWKCYGHSPAGNGYPEWYGEVEIYGGYGGSCPAPPAAQCMSDLYGARGW